MSELEFVNLEKKESKQNKFQRNKFNSRGQRNQKNQRFQRERSNWKSRQFRQQEQIKPRQRIFRKIPTGRLRRQRNNNNNNKNENRNRQQDNNRDQQRNKRRERERGRDRIEQRDQQRDRPREREIIPKGPKPNVIIRGLDPHQTEVGLREFCSQFGPMDMCKLERDNFGNVKPEGIGLIRFIKLENAEAFVEKIDNETVNVGGGDQNQLRKLSAQLIGKKNQNSESQSKGVLQITRGPIKKQWRR